MVNQVLLNMYKEIIIPSLVFTVEIELNVPLQPMWLLKVELSKIRKLKMSPLQTQNVAHCVTTSFWEITCSELPKNYKVTVLSDDVFFLDSLGRSHGLTAAAPVPFPLCLHNAFWSHTLTWLKNSLNKNKLFLGKIHFSNLVQNCVWTVASVLLQGSKLQYAIWNSFNELRCWRRHVWLFLCFPEMNGKWCPVFLPWSLLTLCSTH